MKFKSAPKASSTQASPLLSRGAEAKAKGAKNSSSRPSSPIRHSKRHESDLAHYFAAVRAGDLKFVAKHVSKCNVHLVDGYTQTFLHWASYAGHVEVVKRLLKIGANVNALDKNGFTPLHSAVSSERTDAHLHVCNLLLQHGACPNASTSNGTSALHYLSRHPWSQTLCTSIELLIQRGGDVNLTEWEHGETALHQAALRGSPKTVELLLKLGADIHKLTHANETALHYAARGGTPEMVCVLLDKGANTSIVGDEGTALDVALRCQHKQILTVFNERFKISCPPSVIPRLNLDFTVGKRRELMIKALDVTRVPPSNLRSCLSAKLASPVSPTSPSAFFSALGRDHARPPALKRTSCTNQISESQHSAMKARRHSYGSVPFSLQHSETVVPETHCSSTFHYSMFNRLSFDDVLPKPIIAPCPFSFSEGTSIGTSTQEELSTSSYTDSPTSSPRTPPASPKNSIAFTFNLEEISSVRRQSSLPTEQWRRRRGKSHSRRSKLGQKRNKEARHHPSEVPVSLSASKIQEDQKILRDMNLAVMVQRKVGLLQKTFPTIRVEVAYALLQSLEMRADICYDWLIQRAWPPKPDSSRRDFLCELEIILTQ